ncbi:MAG: alpha-glucan family phosphorylase [Akkermansiaceae bacterium]|nr:alpha-glucan family phosphorylase [Akkermansiaceae bacterium]NNM29632.1 alpha-glucan family phosphorylase [Akkermansiaceae bacterium]
MSFLPSKFAHPYPIDPKFKTSVAYFSMEYAIDQTLKTYSGGLGFLAGSHMRSAFELKQNLVGIGMLWTYGYYHQIRGEDREMAVQRRRNIYHFLEDPGIEFQIIVHDHPVWVKAYYLPAETFGSAPLFLLTTDIDKNDPMSRSITMRLYDSDFLTRIAQYIVLGIGGAKLLDELGVDPDVYHLNEAHALSAAFYLYGKTKSAEEVKKRLVFTTHTPEAAGNETHELDLLQKFSFFNGLTEAEVHELTGIKDNTFVHTLAALRMSRISNGVSKLHGEVSRQMWSGYDDICPITHITNAQNKKYWVDAELETSRIRGDIRALRHRKRDLKEKLFRVVADQTGRLFDPDVLTIVWARRFAGYKRADLITRAKEKFDAMLRNTDRPVQVIWAGKPYPKDQGAIDLFNHLVHFTQEYANAAVLVGYELTLSKLLKDGSDMWLNTPIVTREASGTSGMSAAMNGSINYSTYDGWICEFARDGENSFIIPPAPEGATAEERDQHDLLAFYHILDNKVLPMYYDRPDDWWRLVMQSMEDVYPAFDSDRMASEYYEKLYNAKYAPAKKALAV